MKSTIAINNLSLSFAGSTKPLFQNEQYRIEQNSLTLIKGKNGAGKSTLFSILTAQHELQKQVKGTITSNSKLYVLSSPEYALYARLHITLVPQSFDEFLVPNATFQENLSYTHLGTYPSPFSRTEKKALPELAQAFHIPCNTPVSMLSGGQRQILAILMALERSTQILLLDEPTATLDEQNARLVMEFLITVIKEQPITILMICHDSSLYSYATGQTLIVGKAH